MKTLLTIATITTILLTGCSGSKAKTTEYYNGNIEEAKSVVEECKNISSPSTEQMANCSNAKSAVWNNGGLKTIKGDEKSVKTWKE